MTLRCSRRLFIILVSLTMTWFSEKIRVSWTLTLEKMLISTRCIHGFMSNLIKKSWTDSMFHRQLNQHMTKNFDNILRLQNANFCFEFLNNLHFEDVKCCHNISIKFIGVKIPNAMSIFKACLSFSIGLWSFRT